MSYFSVDEAIEKIKNSHTRILFKEVHSSYSMGNYRSAVVMLWSVVVTDLVFKLQELESIYEDTTACRILKDIKTEQERDPKSSKWEMKIIEKFHKELFFFDTPEVAQMENLQNMRHVSAHPVINNINMLHMPSKSLVYSLMQSALEAVLMKDALFSSQMIKFIIDDLSRIKDVLTTFEDKERYFCHKFLNKMSEPILVKFIETLWKFSFKISNSDTDDNRKNNLVFLEIIFKQKKEIFLKFMIDKKEYISNLIIEENLVRALLFFLISKKPLLNYFEKDSVDILKAMLTDKPYYFYEYLLFQTPIDYCNYLNSKNYELIPVLSLNALKSDCEETNTFNDFLSVCIEGYSNSKTFDRADKRFKVLIHSNLDRFSLEQLDTLIQKINKNYQVYGRSSASNDHKLIIERVLSIDPHFEFKKYREFIRGNEAMLHSPKVQKQEDLEES
ncbi:hypothetical protein [Acinetobacter terrae]|uniref:Uncharacterized protein n=1 Tax=Acinetobacter terrae TaxID=2731247 RepID=A0ABX1UZU2_9GAMM|nr:hypothetical protein [Acinetobacter terrae]NNH86921.1 hypothetical protein [Acinetobacter terrae]